MLQTEGATLLEVGYQSERERFIYQMKGALEDLIKHLHEAGAASAQTEIHQTCKFTGGELTGYIDLLATFSDGSEAIVDIKWGGKNYRRDNMRKSSYLQLAVYAHLRSRGAQDSLPALSYFIIEDSWMLSLDHSRFPNAECVTPTNEENWGQFWQRFEASWSWRWEQIASGKIEVTLKDTAPTENSATEEGGLPIPESSDNFNDYEVLTGWAPEL